MKQVLYEKVGCLSNVGPNLSVWSITYYIFLDCPENAIHENADADESFY